MKILIHEWNHFFRSAIYDICKKRGIECDSFTRKFSLNEYSEEFLDWFDKNVPTGKYDFVLSVNFWPMVALACKNKGYKYVAWCYDCPLNISYKEEETLGFDTNYVFLFDRNQWRDYYEKGIKSVYHLPLGTNLYSVNKMLFSKTDREKYSADISLVGKLYESQLPIIGRLLNEEVNFLFKEMVVNQEELYNYNLFGECVTDELIEYMNKQYSEALKGTDESFFVNKKALLYALYCEVTRRNRLTILNLLGRRYDTRLYSYDSFPILEGVKQCGVVDYVTDMPKVFHFSKINLNPVFRGIETGIPLRAFDIMGFGGFLLSSYQEELDELFVDGEELVLYDSYADAIEKTDFYLKHDDLRERIANNGKKKVLEEYTLQKAFDKILNTLNV